MKHFLTLQDYDATGIAQLLGLASQIKSGKAKPRLAGKTLAMLFQKTSTRTRVSFEAAMTQMAGHAMYIDARGSAMSTGESIADTARTLGLYSDAIMARLYEQRDLEEIAKHAGVPVINGMTNQDHPCQTLADLLTVQEMKRGISGMRVAFVGDCAFNMFKSTLYGFSKMGADVVAVCPERFAPSRELLKRYAATVEHSTTAGVRGADVVYTDAWVSIGQEAERQQRLEALAQYQVSAALLKHAKRDCIVMHCLPAHRGQEITDEVMDGKQSAVWRQAENRLHAQKAVLAHLLG
jgi:ornithine carbamoyltransferase